MDIPEKVMAHVQDLKDMRDNFAAINGKPAMKAGELLAAIARMITIASQAGDIFNGDCQCDDCEAARMMIAKISDYALSIVFDGFGVTDEKQKFEIKRYADEISSRMIISVDG